MTITPAPGTSGAGGRRVAAGLVGAALTLAAIAVLALLVGVVAYLAPGPKARGGQATTVILRKGAGVSEIGAALKTAHAVASAQTFAAAAELTGAARRLKPGEYLIPSGASLKTVLRKIRTGDIVHHKVSIPEGLSSLQVANVLRAADVLTGDVPTPPEGAVLPDTYEVVRGDSRAAVLQRMMDDRDKLLAELWAGRRQGLPYAGPQEAVTLASIVEKETSKAAERPRVAAVYLNRLKIGMKLDADPSVIYGITRGLPLGRGLTTAELQSDDPYNSYTHTGLPPTPIANPGRASLAAVMDPPSTEELYFVADGTGGHVFARTLAEQDANVARYVKLMRARTDAAKETAKAKAAAVTPPREHR